MFLCLVTQRQANKGSLQGDVGRVEAEVNEAENGDGEVSWAAGSYTVGILKEHTDRKSTRLNSSHWE